MASVFEEFTSTSEVREAFGDRSFVSAMLAFEAALARAQAALGLIPESAAASIIGTCKVDLFDTAKIVRESARAGSLAIPMVRSLKETVGLFNPGAVDRVHLGCSHEDLVDTAMSLIARDVLDLIRVDLEQAIDWLLRLAHRHADTPVLERHLMRPASVTSFGLKCLEWAAPLVRGQGRLLAARQRALRLRLGCQGAALKDEQWRELLRRMAQDLALGEPLEPWDTQRDEWAALGCELGLLVGSVGSVAKGVALMSQLEVAELSELHDSARPDSGDTMARRNTVPCAVALAAAQRLPQRVAGVLASLPLEHERAQGSWQVEQAEWAQLMMLAHAGSRALLTLFNGLHVDAEKMQAHVAEFAGQHPKATALNRRDAAQVSRAAQQVRSYLAASQREVTEPAPVLS